MKGGRVRDLSLRSLSLSSAGQEVQFWCQLLRVVLVLIFGICVSILLVWCGLYGLWLVGLVGSFLVALAVIRAGFAPLVGESAGMALLAGLVRLLAKDFLDCLLQLFGYPGGSGVSLLAGTRDTVLDLSLGRSLLGVRCSLGTLLT